jgi:PAS domain S-box-containing protein
LSRNADTLLDGDDVNLGGADGERAGHPSASLPLAVFDQLFVGTPVGLAVVDTAHRYVRVNPALARMNGRAEEDHLGRSVAEVLGDAAPRVSEAIDQVLATGEPVEGVEMAMYDGHHVLVAYTPLTHEDGTPAGVIALVQDVSHRKRAELALGRALNRMTRLQRVTAALSAALTVEQVAEVILHDSAEAIGASFGVMGIMTERGLEFVGRPRHLREMPRVLALDAALPMPEAVRRRSTVVVESREHWTAEYEMAPVADFEGFVAVPLLFEGRARACMGLGLPLAGAPDEQDIGLLNAIARQGAQAVERARLFDERASIARILQQGLLPREIPVIPGVDLAVRYQPVGGGSSVGGDFYDVLELNDGSWLAVVGDVCGKGAQAAVHSGLLRTTIAAMSLHACAPAEILELANRALMRQGQSWPYATVVCASFRPVTGGLHVDVASAGHPPALLRRVDGGLREVNAEGLMVGVQAELRLRTAGLSLRPGDALALFTDGMVDASADGERFGEERLSAVIAQAPTRGAEEMAEHIAGAVLDFETGSPRDDRALLVLRAP